MIWRRQPPRGRPGDWTVTLQHLGHDAAVRPLTAGFRVPREVLELANRLLPHIARDVPPATSVRHSADALTFVGGDELISQVRDCVAVEGSVGVIVPDARLTSVLAQLRASGIDAHPLAEDADERVTVVPAGQAKGLEYDSVVLLEPAEIVAAEPTRVDGLRRLYVVLTRAVSRLRIVHDAPLPAELAEPR